MGRHDASSLEGVRDILVGLRTVLVEMAEQKVAHIEAMGDDVRRMVRTAERMELEKLFIDEVGRLAGSRDELAAAAADAGRKVESIRREYL